MTTVLLYLTACSVKNRVVRRLGRLREPRYLAGAVAGALYLYWAFLRQQFRRGRRGAPEASAALQRFAGPIQAGGALLLWLAIAVRWIFPARSPLQFSGAEVQFLFPAPIPRQALVHYKLLRSQVGILVSTVIAMLFAGGLAASNRLSFLLGLWLLLSTLRLHGLGIALNRASLVEPGGRRRLRTWLPAAVTALASVVLVGALAAAVLPLLAAGADPERIGAAFLRELEGGVAGVVLWPLALLVRPVLAPWPWGFLRAAWPAAVLLALNYAWVIRSDARLEEAALATERRRSEGRSPAPTATLRRAPFALSPAGRPEVAILWKNLLMLGRYASARNVMRFAAPLVVIALAMGMSSRSSAAAALAPICLAVAGGMVVLGPQMVRNDLRTDLAHLPILKGWPLRGEAIVGGEILAPTVIISVVAWTAIALALLLGLHVGHLSIVDRAALALAAMIVVPPVALVQLVIQNGVAVLFPGWVVIGPNRGRGIEAMGQQMLLFAATILLLALGLLPAVAVAGLAGFVLYLGVGWAGAAPAAALLAALVAGEVWLAVRGLGRVLDRTDPAGVEAPG